ncbi:AMP-binding protein [Ferviditalea candida]|uniref:AMP-binding protein n=1 Tax=Ferviditalea candida TaxID=3108399 RepID=A0ABU5ZKB6_9BACL|nr:AMP-binding protein [Paenibacillaceae bacterium T2]
MHPEGSRLTEQMINEYVGKGLWSNTRLFDHLENARNHHPNKTAVAAHSMERSRVDVLTYAELYEKADQCAKGLLALGVQPSDVVSVQLPNYFEFPVLFFAINKIGAVFNGLTHIYRANEVRFILQRSQSKVFVIPDEFRKFDYIEMVKEIWNELPDLQKVIVAGRCPDGDERFVPFEKIVSTGGSVQELPYVNPNEIAQLGFTSGTTGEPKGVMHTHNTLDATIRNYAAFEKLDGHVCNLIVSPVGHQTGFLWGAVLTTYLQGTAVYLDIWKAEAAAQIINQENVSMMIAAVPFLQDLHNKAGSTPMPSLKFISIPGAPIPRKLVETAAAQLDCKIVPAWGMTEYGIAIAVAPEDPKHALQTDGRRIPGAEIRIVGEHGHEAFPNEEGDLKIKGAGVFVGYYKRPDFTEKHFDADGWFDTGDRAVMDENGFISITGRTKDIIIRGGENIPVAEIENLLYEWDKVRDVAIVGMPDERLGERACAYLVLKDGESVTFEEMIDYLSAKKIAKQKLPERLEIVKELPRTISGKVQKYVLRNAIKNKLQGRGDEQ